MAEKRGPKLQFERRTILKMISALPAAALMPSVKGLAVSPAAASGLLAPEVRTIFQPKVLNAHEWLTVRMLCDWIIPADERSGSACEAGVPEFIDDWLDFKRGDLLDSIRGGLIWLDVESNRSFAKDFADCATEQQKQILDRVALPGAAVPADTHAALFFSSLRDLVVSGFFTSEVGLRDLPYLGNEPQAQWQGCPTVALAKLGLVPEKNSS